MSADPLAAGARQRCMTRTNPSDEVVGAWRRSPRQRRGRALAWLEAGVAALTVVGYGIAVGVVTVYVLCPGHISIQKVAVDSEIAVSDWLEARRQREMHGQRGWVGPDMLPSPPPNAIGLGRSFDASERIPRDEQVPGVSWLRRMPNTTYARPRAIPCMLYERYQSFPALWDLVREGGGEFVTQGRRAGLPDPVAGRGQLPVQPDRPAGGRPDPLGQRPAGR